LEDKRNNFVSLPPRTVPRLRQYATTLEASRERGIHDDSVGRMKQRNRIFVETRIKRMKKIMSAQNMVAEITADTLKDSNALKMVWNVFEEFVSHQCSAEGISEFQNHIEYSLIKGKLENSEIMMWGFNHNGKVIGTIATRPPSHISLLFVDKEYHRKGIAHALYQKVIDYYWRNGECLEITVNSSLYAVEVYKRLGFEVSGTEQEKNGIRFVPMTHKMDRPASNKHIRTSGA